MAFFVPRMVCFCYSSDGMSEQGGGRKDVSPRRPSKKSDRTSSVERGSRGKEPVPAAPREFEPVPSTSQLSSVREDTAQATNEKLDRLTALLSGFIETCSAGDVPATPDFSGFHDVSSSDESPGCDADPLDALDGFLPEAAHSVTQDQQDVFRTALSDLAGSFLGEEEKGEPLADNLAQILHQSLRRRPNDESVKATAAKVKLPVNVGNFTVPVTNADVAKALSFGGRLLDARVFRTTCLLSKAIVPLARLLSDFGDKKNLSLDQHLMGLNSSLRLLTAAFNYMTHIRKEIVRFHVQDSALAKLCTWDCEVGTAELFPFDVAKKCDELHKTRQLGGSSYKHRPSGGTQKRFKPYVTKRQWTRQDTPSSRFPVRSRPFLGHRQGRWSHRKLQ